MLFKRFVVFLALLLLLASCLLAELKLPQASGYINDFSGTLTSQEKNDLTAIAQSLKQATGVELAVAIVGSVEPLSPKEYAVKLFEKWAIGEKGKDNGVLVLLTMKERRIEIEVGYGLEGVLNDALAGKILDSYAVPYFKQGEMAKGLLEAAKAISKVVSGEQLKLVSDKENDDLAEIGSTALEVVSIFGGILFILVVSLLSSRFGKAGVIGITTSSGIVMGWFFVWSLLGGLIGGIIGLCLGIWLAFFSKHTWRKFSSGDWWNDFGGGGWSSGGGFRGFGGFGGGRSGGGGAGRGW